tara:strand:+ start:5129 stop:5902 length:774 start_codon:yes stop_codon:yes gene_type:complete
VDEIPDIQIDSISIPDNSIDRVSPNIPNVQPITLTLEQPNLIFEIPGCVESHPDSGNNKKLKTDDDRGVQVYCDAGMPSFNPVDYRPENIEEDLPEPTTPKINPAKQEAKQEQSTSTTDNNNPPPTNPLVPKILPCPRPDDLPVGAIGKYGTKIIRGYERDGNQCKVLYEERGVLEVVNTYTPPPTTLLNTSAIAITSVIGVTVLGQPIAKMLQKQMKGQVKKISKKITKKLLAIRGKKPKVLSLRERQAEQRGLKK